MLTLIVVRHGQTVWNAEMRWQGWNDSPLTDTGETQAREAAQVATQFALPTAVYTSDLGRAVQTAQIAARELGISDDVAIVRTNTLRERFYGSHEGLNATEIETQYPGTRYKAGRDDRENYRTPGGGETYAEARRRVDALLARLAVRHADGETVMLVTHSGVVRLLDSMAQGKSLEDIWDRHPPNACVYVLQLEAGNLTVVRDMMEGNVTPGVPY